jgi:hypothetical protein
MDYLEYLLRNWGKWAHDDDRPHAVSSTQVIISRLKLYSNSKPKDSEEYGAQPQIIGNGSPVDEALAMKVDRAICQLPSIRWDDKKGIDILRMVYLKPWISFSIVCLRCNVKRKVGREYLEKTKNRLKMILDEQNIVDS